MFFYSESESKRFKLNVHRGIGSIRASEIGQYLIENEVDLLILRTPVEAKEQVHDLFNLGFPTLHADNLVTYTAELQKIEINSFKNKLSFEEVNSENAHEIREMIPTIFAKYQNHYSSNNFIAKKDILDGYIEWASSSLNRTEGNIGWIAKLNGESIGFATCSFDKTNETSEGVLYGILPKHAKSGFYTDLFRQTLKYFKEKNFKLFNIPTQIQNFAVQKVWTREGLKLTSAYDTYHINSFLKNEQKVAFEAASEFDFQGEMLKQIKKFYPKSTLLNSSMVRLATATTGDNYQASYRLINQIREDKVCCFVVKIFDSEKTCAIFYNTIQFN